MKIREDFFIWVFGIYMLICTGIITGVLVGWLFGAVTITW